jgi:hypothetical protein
MYLNEDGGGLRVITASFDENGLLAQNVYLLNEQMDVIGSLGGILPGETVSRVQFADGFVFFYTSASDTPAFVVHTTADMTAVPELTAVQGSVYSYEKSLLSFRATNDGYTLSLYDSTGTLLNALNFASDEGKVLSAAQTDVRAIYIDSDGYVGIPVHSFDEFGTQNSYYIFRIADGVITEQTVLRYPDIDDANIFERAIKLSSADGDCLAVIGGGRIVEVRMSDWKVLSVMDYLTR